MINPDEQTMDYYHRNAAGFVAGTVNASLDQSLTRFAELLPAGGCVLDWGCGSGRDSLALRKLGFEVTSADASPSMAAEALAATGTTVRVETFGELSEQAAYDGIWACASLLHVKPDDLPDVFERAARALKDGGVLYCSFKYGRFEGYRNGRWFTDLDEDALSALLAPRFRDLALWRTADVRPGRGDELWLNCLAAKR